MSGGALDAPRAADEQARALAAAAPAAVANAEPFEAARAYYTLGLLLLVMIACHVDRNILNILLEPIRQEFGVSDTALGFLTGPAFALFYTLAGIPLALLADRTSRKLVLVVGLALWSLMTAAQGWVALFSQLAAARLLVGIGEATATPSGHALVADHFPPGRRAFALGVFALAGHVGMLIGYAFGGWANDALGWRAAFKAAGLAGVPLAVLLAATLRERRPASAGPHASFVPTLRFLARKPSFRHLSLAASLYTLCAYGFNAWGATFLMRTHGWSTSRVGVWFGLATGVSGILGTLAAGWVADRAWRRDPRYAAWIGSLGGLALLPFSAGFLFAADARHALVLYAAQVFLGTFWMGPTFAAVQGLAEPRMRALASALILFAISVIGLALGPFAIGAASEALQSRFGEGALRIALLGVAGCAPWAALHGLCAARTLRRDLATER